MYRGTPSPIFDVPEFPTLRRVKPLPKRRRTTAGTGNDNILSLSPTSASALAAQGASILQQSAAAAALFNQQQGQGGQLLDALGPNPTADELLAHADTLSARMTLQNYYMPMLGGVQSLLAGAAANGGSGGESRTGLDHNSNNTAATAAAAALAAVAGAGRDGQLPLPPLSDLDSLQFGVHFAAAAAAAAAAGVAMGGLGGLGLGFAGMNMNMGMGIGNVNMGLGVAGGVGPGVNGNGNRHGNTGERERSGRGGGYGRDHDDDGRGDRDYMDHLRQPGHTKKRKMPANASPRGGSGGGDGGGRPGSPLSSYLDDEGQDGGGEDLQFQLHRERERERDRDKDRDHDRSRSRDDYSPTSHSHSRSNSASNSSNAYPHNPAYSQHQNAHLSMYPPPPFPGQLSQLARKRGKLTAVTLAGLQHKELLKTRKRQLTAVMGALSHGDTLALDQALTSASCGYGLGGYGYVPGSIGGGGGETNGDRDGEGQQQQQGPTIRRSKRRTVRLARAMKLLLEMPERRVRHPDAVPFPEGDFEFVCPSGTADRLIATKEEVATLRKRFEAELEKQAAKAAKMAVQAAAANTSFVGGGPGGGGALAAGGGGKVKATGGKGKRERQERDRERAERAQAQMQQRIAEEPTANGISGKENVNLSGGVLATPPSVPPLPPTGGKSKNGKKKKRSALANASNPHHLKNYVPSRLPHSDGFGYGGVGGTDRANGLGAGANTIWPLPIKFLSSEIPPRRTKKSKSTANGNGSPPRAAPTSGPNGNAPTGAHIPLTYPTEEWICAFCEYDLFYGEDTGYKRAVRNRKKILRRRRRARERAARAASGAGTPKPAAPQPPAPPPSEDGEEEEGYDEEGYEELGGGGGGHGGQGLRAGRWKGGGGPDG